jgi:hypothetical protein
MQTGIRSATSIRSGYSIGRRCRRASLITRQGLAIRCRSVSPTPYAMEWARTVSWTNAPSHIPYTAGEWSGVALDAAIGGAAGLEAAGANAGKAGFEFSHWIPNRLGGPRSLYNGNYVSQGYHYLTDPFRFPPGWQQYGDKLPALLQQLGRIPWVYPGAAAGAGVGAASAASQQCGCSQ